ncbi:type VII secretion protein EsaA [Streptococcus suis]|nr:type VII secretion protein EsaA [Streptococcus suis]
MSKKVLLGLGALLLAITMIFSFFAIVKPIPISRTSSEVTTQNTAIKVAVVNEDVGVVYNGEQVNIANTLVNSFIAKNNYTVEVVSRSIAESGLKNDTYQLMIVLPSKFSAETLALESRSPVQANFQYQILSEKQLVVKQAEKAVVDFKELFNKDLINIYFTSIIRNLQTAQGQVADVVTSEEKSLTAFNNNLVSPLSLYSKQFTGLGASPSNLLSTYSLFNKELHNSNDAFKSIIDVNKTYEGPIEQIKAQQDLWQRSLNTREQNLLTYDEAFSKLSVEEQLAKLVEINTYITTNLSEPAVWKETTDTVTAYNQDITTLLEKLRTLNAEIDTTLADYDTKIKEAVEVSLKENNAVVNGANQTLGSYISSLNTSMATQIENKWPSYYYDDSTIDSLSLSNSDKQHLKNVNAFLNWYSTKTGLILPTAKTLAFERDEVERLKQYIKTNIESQHTIEIPFFEGKIESVSLSVPTGYALNVMGYQTTDLGSGNYQVHLPAGTVSGTVIPYTLSILDESVLSVLSPVAVKLTLDTTEDVTVINESAPYQETTEQSTSSTTSTVTTSSTDAATSTSGTSNNNPTNTSVPKEIVTVTNTITITKVNQTDTKVVKRRYEDVSVISNWSYNPKNISIAIYQDVKDYLQLSGLVSGYYGLDLSQGSYSISTIVPANDSIAALANSDDLKSIVVNLIKATTVEALKSDLRFSDEELASIESRLANAEALNINIDNLRLTTNDLMSQLARLVELTTIVHTTINEKPSFTESEKVDNTDMVTVSMDLNSDLAKLMTASQTLMTNTQSNQAVSETIESNIQQLSNDVTTLEKDGETLSGRVSELQNIMASEYGSNQDFLKNFSTVLSNTKSGNAKNEAVYEYLSNPVDAAKIGNVLSVATSSQAPATRQDDRSGLLIILISYLASLVVAYLMQHADKEELQKRLNVVERLSWKNATGPLAFLSSIAVISGSIIATISGVKLDFTIDRIASFIALLVLVMLIMVYGVNLLLDKLKSVGFLTSIGLLMLYIVTATQLFDAYYVNSTQLLAKLSPLTYLEEVVRDFINQQGGVILPMVLLTILATTLGVGNVFLYRQVKDSK